jgi:mono/diheme cytochrome c family protein
MMKPNGKPFRQNLKFKFPVFVVVAVILWFGTGAVGFPVWWQIEFVSFAFVGLLIFLLLDMPSLKQETQSSQSGFRIMGAYAFPKVLFIPLPAQLPQFNPKYEIIKDHPPIFDGPFYGEDLNDAELDALVAYLKTLRDPTHIPVEGKLGNQWTWWDDAQVIAEGKLVYEGLEPATEGLNCAVCHGKEGTPMMTGAFDLRDPNRPDTEKIADHMDVTLKDFPDELYYKRVTKGIDGTPMAPWGTIFPHLYLWKAEAYARTFHDPLDKRTAKKPVPPIPTKEEIERWKKDGLFLDPLL